MSFFFIFFFSIEWTKFWTKMHENFGISYLNKVLLLAADNARGSNSAADWARRTFRLRFLRYEDLNLRILMQFWLNCLIFIIWMKLRANKDFDVTQNSILIWGEMPTWMDVFGKNDRDQWFQALLVGLYLRPHCADSSSSINWTFWMVWPFSHWPLHILAR